MYWKVLSEQESWFATGDGLSSSGKREKFVALKAPEEISL